MAKVRRKTPEADLQIAIVQWFNWAYPDHAKWLHHSPNGGERPAKEYTNKRGKKIRYSPEGARLKAMGTKPAFPDLVLYHKNLGRVGVVAEVKRLGEEPTEDQDIWLKHFGSLGFLYTYWDNLDDAIGDFTCYMHPIKPRVKV